MRPSVLCSALAAFTLLFFSVPSGAQTVDEVIDRHIAARGGYEKLKAIETIKITRTVATPFSDIKLVIYKKRPYLYRAEQAPTGQPAVPRGVNLDVAWDTLAGGKIVTRPPQGFAEARDIDADFDGLLVDWKAKGHTVELQGKETLPGGEAFKLKVTTKSGAVRTVYLDAKTYLDRRHTGVVTLPNRQFNFVTDFSGWKDVNGVKFAFDINEDRTGKEPAQSLVTYTEKIEVNVPMADSLFATPTPAAPKLAERAEAGVPSGGQ